MMGSFKILKSLGAKFVPSFPNVTRYIGEVKAFSGPPSFAGSLRPQPWPELGSECDLMIQQQI